jgi:hypothetical protein
MSKNKFSLFQITNNIIISYQPPTNTRSKPSFFQTQKGSTDNYSTFGCPDILILEMAISACTTIEIKRKKVG